MTDGAAVVFWARQREAAKKINSDVQAIFRPLSFNGRSPDRVLIVRFLILEPPHVSHQPVDFKA